MAGSKTAKAIKELESIRQRAKELQEECNSNNDPDQVVSNSFLSLIGDIDEVILSMSQS